MMNTIKTIVFFLFTALIVSCNPGDSNKQTAATSNAPTEIKRDSLVGQTMWIDTFSKFPSEIDGYACYFSNDENAFKSRKYIYVDDRMQLGFVYINGTFTKFKLVEEKEITEKKLMKKFMKKFENEQYELIIDMEEVSQLDETWQQKGILKLTKKGGETVTKTIYGECGC